MKKSRLLAAALAVLAAASVCPAAAATAAAPRVASDTPQTISLAQDETYQFKFTVYGTHEKPDIVSGSPKVLKAVQSKAEKEKGGDIYYVQVKAVGEPGNTADVYTTLPGKKAVKQCTVTVTEKIIPFENYYAGFVPDNSKLLKIGEQELPEGDVLLPTKKDWDAFRQKYLRDSMDVGYYSSKDIDFSKYAVLYNSYKWAKQDVMGGSDGLPEKVVKKDGKPVLKMKTFGSGYRITAANVLGDERFVTIVLVRKSNLK